MKSKIQVSQLTTIINLLDEFPVTSLAETTRASFKHRICRFRGQLEEVLLILHNPRIKTDNSATPAKKSEITFHYPYDTTEIILGCTEIINLLLVISEDVTSSTVLKSINELEAAVRLLKENHQIQNKLPETVCLKNTEEEHNFNIIRLIGDVFFLCKTLIVKEEVSLRIEIDPLVPDMVKGEPVQLSKLLLKALGNRIKQCTEGTIKLTVAVRHRDLKNGQIAFSITDINDLSEIALADFKKYAPLSENGSNDSEHHNSFLLVNQIVKILGGEMLISKKQNQYPSLQFIIPFNFGNTSAITKATCSDNFLLTASNLVKGTRILVIEDGDINQQILKKKLCEWGCQIFTAENGSQGLRMLQEIHVDIVITDLKMPGMSGYEFASSIRKSNKYDNISIIAASNERLFNTEIGVMGFNDIILKPFSPDELLLKLIANKKVTNSNTHKISARILPSALEHSSNDQLNLDHVFDECLGQIDLFEELMKLYQKNILEFIGRTKLYLKKSDYESLDFAIHKVKSSLGMLKSNELLQIVEQMDSCLRYNRDLKHLHFLYDCFLQEYPMVLEQLANETNRLKR